MDPRRAPAALVRGRQAGPPGMHWRLDGAGGPRDPLVVALHGYGMDEDFFAVLLQKLFELPMRFLLPRAPHPADVGLRVANGGSWYEYDGDQDRFRRELARVEVEILELIAEVEPAQGLDPCARFLLGFSQGGYAGSWVALRNPDVFDGMIVSGARVKTEFLEPEAAAAAARGFHVLLCHGERDRSVAPDSGRRGRDALAAAGLDVELRTFDAGHSIGRSQVAAIREWLLRVTRTGAAPPGSGAVD